MRPQRRKRKANPARGMRIDGGALRNDGFCLNLLDMITMLIPTAAQQDSENEMWNMYMNEVKKDDKRMADAWKENSNGILVFVSLNLLVPLLVSMTRFKTGLFSATVGAFIIEFYKQLSPSSGIQTVIPLANGSYTIIASQPPPPKASIIWVNAMWLISLVLSLTSALIATLLQQWARRYVEMPNDTSEPNERARVRWCLFLGAKTYKMRVAVQIAPTLLHLSVYLFFAGLVIVFHTINKNVSIAVDVSVGVFALAYMALSLLPCLDVSCPYRTPMSNILWYPLHAIPYVAAFFLRWFLAQLHGWLVPPNLDHDLTARESILVNWLSSRENAIRTHRRYITDGLRRSIIQSATKAQEDVDCEMVSELFSRLALGDKSKLRKFAATIPRDKVLDLITPIESGRIVLREPLRILLQSCAAGWPDEEVPKRSLLVCLGAIHDIAKTPNLDVPELNYARANFADVGLMQALWNDSDTSIRFTSRSICALLARQVLRGSLEEQQLRWLHGVTGEPSGAIYNANDDMKVHMNLKSFVYGVLSGQVGDLPPGDAMSFNLKEILAILLDVRKDAHFDTNFDMVNSQYRITQEVGWIIQDDPQGSREVVDKLRSIFPFLPANTVLYLYAPILPPQVSTHPT